MKKLITLLLTLILVSVTVFSVGCKKPQDNSVSIKDYKDGSLIKDALQNGAESIGMLPEPAASMLEKQTPNTTWYRLDVQELYDGVKKAYPQAVIMVKSSLLNTYPQIVSQIESKISDNVEWAKANGANAISAISRSFPTTTLKAPMFASSIIDNCKIYFESANSAKQSVNKYISDIKSIDNKSANTVLDSFYYDGTASGTFDKDSITFCAPDGAPAIAIAKFIFDGENFGTGKSVNYQVVKADQIVAKMASSSADVIVMPINGATKKYNADGNASNPYKLVSVLTHGNFYIMSKTKITVKDLANKRIAIPNMGAVPDWTFQLILNKNNLGKIIVD